MDGAIDSRLQASSAPLTDLKHCAVRLQNDARFPWLVLIPRKPALSELSDLIASERAAVIEETVHAGRCLRRAAEALGRPVEKLNIAALGNVVPQLHLHVVGRRRDDDLWPDPVWGRGVPLAYEPGRLEAWRAALSETFRDGVSDERRSPPLKGMEDLLALLESFGLAEETMRHEPVFRVSDGQALKRAQPGGHAKNLFLKDAKGQLWLLVAEDISVVDLKALPGRIGSARLSFASAERLQTTLGVSPGSVTPFALANDPDQTVRLVLDAALLRHDQLNFHPLTNAATTRLTRAAFLTFLERLGRSFQIVEFRRQADCGPALGEPF